MASTAPAPGQHFRLKAAPGLFNRELLGGSLKPDYRTVQNKPGSWVMFMPYHYSDEGCPGKPDHFTRRIYRPAKLPVIAH